jgi:hypothetical protein
LRQFLRGGEANYSLLAWHIFEIHPEYSSWRSAFAIFGRAGFVYELGSRASTPIPELSAKFFSFHVDQCMPRGGGADRLHSLLDSFASAFALARRVSCWIPFSNSAVSCFDQLCTPVVLSSLLKKGNQREKHFGNFTIKHCSYGATAERFTQNN